MLRKCGMIPGCEYIDYLKTCIGPLPFLHAQQFGASSVRPRPSLFDASGWKQSPLRLLWPSVPGVLRSQVAPDLRLMIRTYMLSGI